MGTVLLNPPWYTGSDSFAFSFAFVKKKNQIEKQLQTCEKIIEQISNNSRVTMTDLANLTGYSRRWVAQTIKRLQEQNIIKRIGSDKSGYWEIIGK